MSKTEITSDGYSTPSGVRPDDPREADLAAAGRSSEKPETRNEERAAAMSAAHSAPRCRHAHSSGKRCGSPAVAGAAYCYFHRKVRKPETKRIMVPVLDEATQIQFSITHALNDFARGRLSRKDLGIYLWALQMAKLNLPKVQEELAEAAKDPAVEDSDVAIDRLLSDHDYHQFAEEANRADLRNYRLLRDEDSDGLPRREPTDAEWDELKPIMTRMGDHASDFEQPQPEYFDLEPKVETQPAASLETTKP